MNEEQFNEINYILQSEVTHEYSGQSDKDLLCWIESIEIKLNRVKSEINDKNN